MKGNLCAALFQQTQRAHAVELRHRKIGKNDVDIAVQLFEKTLLGFHALPFRRITGAAQLQKRQLRITRGIFENQDAQPPRHYSSIFGAWFKSSQYPNLLHGRGEPLEVHRFDDVAVHSELVAFHHVVLFLR